MNWRGLLALSSLASMTLGLVVLLGLLVAIPAGASGEPEVCPHNGGWTKVDNLSDFTYTINAPSGKLIAEWCAKFGDNLAGGGAGGTGGNDEDEAA